ncbi:hypothetical protein [Pseudoroseomonas cervicalis]|uniref:hypothetical protein n=1 Tax=Teichococcus cervicalis TaxID=204525 RepID=UPI0022F1D65C|nr:hypothetical protein [Pseudoroseomonas cervicalis]WBV42417.1 hypothetical protein PFY06_14390 [Pseudoroseomonas cervicalis]
MRRVLSLVLAAAMLAAALPSPALARTEVFAEVGGWHAFLGTSDAGSRLCGLGTTGSAGKQFYVKHFAGNAGISIHIFKQGWSIPAGRPILMGYQFDRSDIFRAPGAAGSGTMISFELEGQAMVDFFNMFRAGRSLNIHFLEGDEGGWTVNLTGSTAIAEHFARCLIRWSGQGLDTQPFAPSAPSQPFSSAPPPTAAPAQPFKAPLQEIGPAPRPGGRRT